LEENCFVSDIILPNMLHALTVRSPVAKGRLVSIECPALPDGYMLISAKDIPGKNCLDDSDIPILTGGDLSYIGEPVALLLGPDINILEERIRNCKVIVEEGAPVFNTGEADPAMLLNRAHGAKVPLLIAAKREFSTGDVDAAFSGATSVISGNYITGIQEHWYAEPCGAVSWSEQGRIIVRTATQWPSHVMRSVCGVLGVPASKVLVMPTITGLHMDGKLWYSSLVSCHASLGAWIAKQPVRLILTGEEDFCFSPKRFGTEIHFSSAINEKGEISGLEINAIVNLGAQAVNADEILEIVNLGSIGVYRIKNVRFCGAAIRTNIPPQGPLAGFGLAQGFFALESHISYIADSIGQDPAQWRKQNFHAGPMGRGGSSNKGSAAKGAVLKSPPHSLGNQLVDNVLNISDYRRKWAAYEVLKTVRKNSSDVPAEQSALHRDSHLANWMERTEGMRGIGIALGYQGNDLLNENAAMYPSSVELTLNKDGVLEIKTGIVDSDHASVWTSLASEILEIDKKKVRISYNADSRDSGPSTSSRNITILTKLIEQACKLIHKRRAVDPLPITVRKTVRPQKNDTSEERLPKGVIDLNNLSQLGWASSVVEVEFDPIGYLPRIRGVWMCVDGGKIFSEDKARKNLKTSIVQALGWAYREQIGYVNGAIPVDQFENFDILGLSEIPPIVINFIKSNSEEPKGIGDLPFSCIPAAFVQAVSQAAGCHFRAIPLKAQDIFSAGRLS
jgi:CO/xanthine dehydrogenase Mo-binding subunit